MNTHTTQKLEDIISKSSWYYTNNDLTTEHFPIPDKIETDAYKLIKMRTSFSSQEALDKIKRQGCRPANAYELALWANEHRETDMPKGTWSSVIAFGQIWKDSDGFHRVPFVDAHSDGDFGFGLGRFEGDWLDDRCLLAFCDPELGTLDTSVKPLESLTLRIEKLEETLKNIKALL